MYAATIWATASRKIRFCCSKVAGGAALDVDFAGDFAAGVDGDDDFGLGVDGAGEIAGSAPTSLTRTDWPAAPQMPWVLWMRMCGVGAATNRPRTSVVGAFGSSQ